MDEGARLSVSASPIDARLLALLVRHTGGQALEFSEPPAPLTGGFWAQIYAFRLRGAPPELSAPLVLRLIPETGRGLGEAVIQGAVARAGYPAPRVHFYGDANSGLGLPFVIMDRARGGSLAQRLGAAEGLAVLRRMPALLADCMRDLHALDPTPVQAALDVAGIPRSALELEGLLLGLEGDVERLGLRGLRRAFAWLAAHRPAPSRLVLCHGDLHAYNLVFDGGRVSAVLDWTNARLAPPGFDISYTAQLLHLMPVPAPSMLRPVLRWLGARSSRQFLAAYAKHSAAGFDPQPDPWFEALHSLRLLVRLAQSRAGLTTTVREDHPWLLAARGSADSLRHITGVDAEL